EIEGANKELWEIVNPDKRVPYNVLHPFDCYMNLFSFTRGALRTNRVILLPFGPKLFALNCLLVASVHRGVAVWHVSSGKHGEALDRVPDGQILGLTALFEPRDKSISSERHVDRTGSQ